MSDPKDIELLLRIHQNDGAVFQVKTEPETRSFGYLLHLGIIKKSTSGHVTVTEGGKQYIRQVLNVPLLPV